MRSTGNPVSSVDKIYRAIIGNGIFPAGWGDAGRIRSLMEFHQVLSKRERVQALIDPDPEVTMEKVASYRQYEVYNGHIFSPFAKYCPGLLPPCSESCRFQFVLPRQFRMEAKPVAIHLAGTGDQHFFRRRRFLAEPLAVRDGIASVIVENPFYGLRRPHGQIRSNVEYVSDIFVMGGGLMLESLAIIRRLELDGYGPFCMTGISMGGHMASLAATNYPKPIAIAPCLSWTTASTVFTRGVMTNAISWDVCDKSYLNEPAFRNEFFHDLIHYDLARDREIPDKNDESQDKKAMSDTKVFEGSPRLSIQWLRSFFVLPKTFFGLSRWNPSSFPSIFSFFNPSQSGRRGNQVNAECSDRVQLNLYKGKDSATRRESLEFMKRLMDHFTHLSNFEKPVDPELATVVSARYDAYVLRDGVKPFQEIWPGSTVRFLESGHVVSYVTQQDEFRMAIRDSLKKHREKYHRDGTPRKSPDPPGNSSH